MAEWKEHAVREPVFGRLNDLDETQDLPTGLRTAAERDSVVGGDPGVGSGGVPPVQEAAGTGSFSARTGPAVAAREVTTGVLGAAAASGPGNPGASMRAMREACELDVATLAQRTRLSRRIIDNLEHNRFDSMPPAYVRGYFRAVARELDCQADDWIRSYETLGFSDPVLRPTVQNKKTAPPPRRSGRLWYVLIGLVLLIGLGLAMFSWTLGSAQNPLAPVSAWVSGLYQDWRQALSERSSAVVPDEEAVQEPPAPVAVPWQETPAVLPRVESSLGDTQLTEPLVVSDLAQESSAPAPDPVAVQDPPAQPAPATVPAPEPADRQAPVPLVSRPDAAAPVPTPPRAQPESPVAAPAPAAPDAAAAPPAAPDTPTAADPPAVVAAAPVQPAEAAPGVSVAPPPGSSRVALVFNDTSWVEIRSANDRVALTGIFHAGEQREVTVTLPARVVLGNAPGVELRRDGRPLGLAPMTRADNTARFTLEAQ